MRVSVIGSSGAGKTTFGRALAARLHVPFLELDSVYHQENWTPLDDGAFRARVGVAVGGDSWVIDGNYGTVRPLVLARATDVVWLDYSRARVMRQVVFRSVVRGVTRRELWNGNRERVREWLSPEHPMRWAWSQHERKRAEYEARFRDPEHGHLTVHRFGSPREASVWLAHIEPRAAAGPPTSP